MVPAGRIVADIGTDHAWLVIYLVQNGISPKCYACDNKKGPLEQAQKHIREAGLSDFITIVLSDGFAEVPEDAQIAVIAGMGYRTAIEILTAAAERLPKLESIILQINDSPASMRRWISSHSFTITQEKVLFDSGHWYTAMACNTGKHAPYSEQEILCGPVLMQEKTPEYLAYAQDQVNRIQAILVRYPYGDTYRSELYKKKKYWQEIVEEYAK